MLKPRSSSTRIRTFPCNTRPSLGAPARRTRDRLRRARHLALDGETTRIAAKQPRRASLSARNRPRGAPDAGTDRNPRRGSSIPPPLGPRDRNDERLELREYAHRPRRGRYSAGVARTRGQRAGKAARSPEISSASAPKAESSLWRLVGSGGLASGRSRRAAGRCSGPRSTTAPTRAERGSRARRCAAWSASLERADRGVHTGRKARI